MFRIGCRRESHGLAPVETMELLLDKLGKILRNLEFPAPMSG